MAPLIQPLLYVGQLRRYGGRLDLGLDVRQRPSLHPIHHDDCRVRAHLAQVVLRAVVHDPVLAGGDRSPHDVHDHHRRDDGTLAKDILQQVLL